MFGKGFLKRIGRVAVHGAKAVYETGKTIGSKVLASPYAMPLAVGALTASGYGTTAIPAFLAAAGTARALQEATQGAMRSWGDQYAGGNRQLGRGNFRSRIPQMRPDGMN